MKLWLIRHDMANKWTVWNGLGRLGNLQARNPENGLLKLRSDQEVTI